MKNVKLWQKSSVLLLLAFSLSGCLGPKLTLCVSDPEAGGFQCFDQRTEKDFFKPYPESGNFVAMPANDYERLLKFMKNGCK